MKEKKEKEKTNKKVIEEEYHSSDPEVDKEDHLSSDPEANKEDNLNEEQSFIKIIQELQVELDQAKNDRLQALAEASNLSKRAEKRIAESIKYSTSNVCKDLLKVADNLERALLAASDNLRKENEVIENLAVGVEMTAKELMSILKSQGVVKIDSLNKVFDPNIHQAMQEIEKADVSPGTIIEVVQEGYMISDRLLRPAMVIVAKKTTAD